MKRTMDLETKKAWKGFLFILPWFLGFVFLFLRQFISAIVYSFNTISIEVGGIGYHFVGLQNYIDAFTSDEKFIVYLTGSLTELLYQVPLIVFFSLYIAVVLNKKFLSCGFYRVVFFLPTIISCGVVLSIIQGDTMYNAMQSGGDLQTYAFETVSVQEVLLANKVNATLVSYIGTVVNSLLELFWYSGVQIVIFLSGLQGISPSLREAAEIDGASGWDFFWLITFPMMSPLLLTNTIYTIIATFSDYSNPVISYTSSLASKLEISFASALAMVYFIITFVIILVVYFLINRKVYYRND